VLILRTVDKQRYIGVYSIRAIERGNYPDPQLFPNDVVMVGDSVQRRRLEAILQILPPLLTSSAILIAQR
jgi:polysaccharide export outer membrane protein